MKLTDLLEDYTGLLSLMIRLLDVLTIVACGLLQFWLLVDPATVPDIGQYYLMAVICGLLLLLLFPMYGVYQPLRASGLLEVLRRLTLAWISIGFLLMAILIGLKAGETISRLWLASWLTASWLAMVSLRFGFGSVLSWLRRRGFNRKAVVVVGGGDLGARIIRRLHGLDWLGLDVVAVFDDMPALQGCQVGGVQVRGGCDQILAFLEQQLVHEVWLALPLRAEQRMQSVLRALRHSTVTVRWVPDMFTFSLINHSMSDFAGVPVLNLTSTPLYGVNRGGKWLEDKVLAGLILILASPLMVAIAIGVKLNSQGPVFYRQERVSWNNRSFMMLKFRTMPLDAEVCSGPAWSNAWDRRAGRFGNLLRQTGLDELPQFVNVLKGDMSVVGPRPERPYFIDRLKEEIPDYMKKHLVKAGITGWAQVNGWCGDTDIGKRIEYDLYYIEHWSLWFDLKIILMTVFPMLRPRRVC